LPGYTWSGPTRQPGWDIRRIGLAFAELLTRLGYPSFGAQGGDWGARVVTSMAETVPERLVGMHLNLVLTDIPDAADQRLTADEQERMAERRRFDEWERGYSTIQGTKPNTLAFGLNDSPAGLAAWLVEKFRAWSDCGGDVESRFTKDDLLAAVSSYWYTGTVGSAARLYYECHRSGVNRPPNPRISVPTGAAIFPREVIRPSREWAERHYAIEHWTEMRSGGHFAAMEEPDALVSDIRLFFRDRRVPTSISIVA
jgi:microsomal epoxide hydrolase